MYILVHMYICYVQCTYILCIFVCVSMCILYVQNTAIIDFSFSNMHQSQSGVASQAPKNESCRINPHDKNVGVSRPGGIISRGRVGVSYSG